MESSQPNQLHPRTCCFSEESSSVHSFACSLVQQTDRFQPKGAADDSLGWDRPEHLRLRCWADKPLASGGYRSDCSPASHPPLTNKTPLDGCRRSNERRQENDDIRHLETLNGNPGIKAIRSLTISSKSHLRHLQNQGRRDGVCEARFP